MTEEKENLYMATVRVYTKGYSIEDAKKNLEKNIMVTDDIYEDPEITTLEHLADYPAAHKRIRDKLWRALAEAE